MADAAPAPFPPPAAPASARMADELQVRTYWGLVWEQFRKSRVALVCLYAIALLFLLSAWAPLLCDGRPLVWTENGRTSSPWLQWFLAPTESMFSVEYLFNYFMFLSLALPAGLLSARWWNRRRAKSLRARRRAVAVAVLAAILLAGAPFVGPGTYGRTVTPKEQEAGKSGEITDWHFLRRWRFDMRDYLSAVEDLDPARGDRAVFVLLAQDSTRSTNAKLHAPGTYALLKGLYYRELPPKSLAAPPMNVDQACVVLSVKGIANEGEHCVLLSDDLPSNVQVVFSARAAAPSVPAKLWIAGDLKRREKQKPQGAEKDQAAATDEDGPLFFTLTAKEVRAAPGPPHRSWHPLGTDRGGRDVLTRLLHGGRVSLSVGLVAEAIAVLLGVIIGGLAGYLRGWVDILISRIMEIVMCFPTFFLIITLIAVMEQRSIVLVMVVIGATGWTGLARLARGEFLRLAEQDFVHSARALGCSPLRTMFRHILPNALGPVLVSVAFGVAGAVGTEAGLSYLGFGVPPPAPSWGEMVRQGMDHMADGVWWLMWFPGLVLFLTLCVYNLAGDGLRDAMDPRLRK